VKLRSTLSLTLPPGRTETHIRWKNLLLAFKSSVQCFLSLQHNLVIRYGGLY